MHPVDKFITNTQGKKPWPLVSNWSPYMASTNYNNAKYFDACYKDRTKFPIVAIFGGNQSFFNFTDEKVENIFAEVLHEYFTNYRKFSERIKKFKAFSNEVDALYEKFTYSEIAKADWSTLARLLEKSVDLSWRLNALVYFCVFPLNKESLIAKLEEVGVSVDSKDVEKVWKRGTEPAFNSFDMDQAEYVLERIANDNNWSEISEDCQFFFTDYFFDTKSLRHCEKELKKRFQPLLNKNLAKLELKKIAGEKIAKAKKYEQWKSSLDPKKQKLADYLQLIMKLRDKRKNIFNKMLTIHHRVAERVFEEAGLSKKFIPICFFKELGLGAKYLSSHKVEIMKRREGLAVYVDEKGIFEFTQTNFKKDLKKLKEHYLKTSEIKIEDNSSQFKGSVGSPGKTSGIVRIVLDVKRSGKKFKKGEILVSGMTRPEFVPLMKKAIAVITDEGGITCHAAIVSRELGIPAVIGTRVATRILKDGDSVEVDANKGIVKILKRA